MAIMKGKNLLQKIHAYVKNSFLFTFSMLNKLVMLHLPYAYLHLDFLELFAADKYCRQTYHITLWGIKV